jgi:hypothetical protein
MCHWCSRWPWTGRAGPCATDPRGGRFSRACFFAVLLAFLVLGSVYSVVTPIFEASDELSHYPVVKHIADGHGLPVQDPAVETAWKQEGSQPPLYYALAALATAWINTDDLEKVLWINPLSNIGKPLAVGNKNLVIHTEAEAFPWRGTVLAVHLIRFLSVVLQAVTVLATYLLVREITPGRPELAPIAAGLVAFNPMFLFIAGSVNNDNLIVPLSSLVLWLLARTVREGALTWRRLLVLGVLLGLAALTKLSGLGLLALTAPVLAALAIHRRQPAALLKQGLALGLLVAGIAGWWYMRNWQLYGDPFGLNVMLDIAGRRPEPPSLKQLWGEFQGFRMSYWGVFGGFNVLAPGWVYRLYDALMLAGCTGWIPLIYRLRGRWRSRQAGQFLILAAWVAIVLLALIRWTCLTFASQGRLIFPVQAALAGLLTYGLTGWLPRGKQWPVLAGVVGVLVLMAAWIPFAVIRPAYARPAMLSPADVPASAQRTDVTYAGTLRMVAFELPRDSVCIHEPVPVTVYWQAVAPSERDLSVYVHLLGRGMKAAGNLGTYPGLGAFSTRLLRPGDLFRDDYLIPVAPDAERPTLLRVDVGLYEYGSTEELGLPAVDAAGHPAAGLIGSVRLLSCDARQPVIPHPLQVSFAGQAQLLGYGLDRAEVYPGEAVKLTLYWEAVARMVEDYHVFVHLAGEGSQPIAQGDKAPLDGDWPTWAWEPGEVFSDTYTVALPAEALPGTYELLVGLYRPPDGPRLLPDGPAERLRGDAVWVDHVSVRGE